MLFVALSPLSQTLQKAGVPRRTRAAPFDVEGVHEGYTCIPYRNRRRSPGNSFPGVEEVTRNRSPRAGLDARLRDFAYDGRGGFYTTLPRNTLHPTSSPPCPAHMACQFKCLMQALWLASAYWIRLSGEVDDVSASYLYSYRSGQR